MKKIYTFLLFLLSLNLNAVDQVNYLSYTNNTLGEIVIQVEANTAFGEGAGAQIRWVEDGVTMFSGFVGGEYLAPSTTPGFSIFTVTIAYPIDISTVDIEVFGCFDFGTCNNTCCFSGFVNTASNLIVPVELVDFKGEKKRAYNVLNWQTASEINNDHFIIERSKDGLNFEEIGKINGNGTTSQMMNYTFTDRKPIPGDNYYRLNQFDFDGANEYSKIILIEGERSSTEVYPNPFTDKVFIKSMEEINSITLYNLSGQVLKESNLRENIVDLHEFKPGVYVIKVVGIKGTYTQKIIKE